jgi:hypothetical protein
VSRDFPWMGDSHGGDESEVNRDRAPPIGRGGCRDAPLPATYPGGVNDKLAFVREPSPPAFLQALPSKLSGSLAITVGTE